MWIGTDYGLNRYDGHSVEVFLNEKGKSGCLPHNRITRINGDGKGHIWIACTPGLVELDLNTMKFQTIFKGNVNAVYFDKEDDCLYAATGRKVLMRNTDKKFSEVVNIGVSSPIVDIVTDGNDMYVGTSGNGIWLFDPKTEKHRRLFDTIGHRCSA